MLQRIQTLFLVIALGACAVCYFMPFWLFSTLDASSSFEVNVFKLNAVTGGLKDMFINTQPLGTWPLLVILSAIACLVIVAITLYKNRQRQIKIVNYSLFLTFLFIAAVYLYIPYAIEERIVDSTYAWQPGLIFPLVALLALIVALRFIKKDEKLVKSADRLR